MGGCEVGNRGFPDNMRPNSRFFWAIITRRLQTEQGDDLLYAEVQKDFAQSTSIRTIYPRHCPNQRWDFGTWGISKIDTTSKLGWATHIFGVCLPSTFPRHVILWNEHQWNYWPGCIVESFSKFDINSLLCNTPYVFFYFQRNWESKVYQQGPTCSFHLRYDHHTRDIRALSSIPAHSFSKVSKSGYGWVRWRLVES